MKSKSNSAIPKTGRIGRFAQIVEEETNQDIAEKVMQDAEHYKSFNYPKKAAWWKGAVNRLEQLAGRETCLKILKKCGQKCCGQTTRKRVKQLMDESESLKEFVEKLNKTGLGGGRLVLQDETTIRGGYDTCYCGQVKQTKEPFDTKYCHCSVGWYTQLVESALGTPVDVELVQSIISGADTCEFIIHIRR